MNFYWQLSSIIFVLQFIATFGQDHTEATNLTDYTLSQNESKDSNITWIKIATSTTDVTSRPTNCTIETTTIEDQNLDIANSSRRKRRKRRRNKYKSSTQRRPDQYKKHSTRVQLDKPVQFLIPPDYQENLIPKETAYFKSRNEVEKFVKKIPPPVRYLLPPFADPFFIPDPPVTRKPEKPKVEWSPNSTNRGATKFKHTIYYSDSGNEIISNYDVTPITTPQPKPRSKEYKPIVVQPMPIRYTTQTVNISRKEPSKERVNSLVSYEVANAGMQVINMSAYQKQQTQFQNQFVVPSQYKQYASPSQLQQTDYQPYQQIQPPPLPDPTSQNYQNQQPPAPPAPPVQPVQPYNQQYYQNYHQTTYSRPPEIRTTTPAIQVTTNRTTTPSEPVDGFKGLEIAESKYFSDLPSEQEFSTALQNDGQVIPGVAGKDYPVFDQTLVQKRRFACRGLEGYFADTSSRCQVFYICNGDGAGEPMLCPNGTLFSQELLVCDWWYNVDC